MPQDQVIHMEEFAPFLITNKVVDFTVFFKLSFLNFPGIGAIRLIKIHISPFNSILSVLLRSQISLS